MSTMDNNEIGGVDQGNGTTDHNTSLNKTPVSNERTFTQSELDSIVTKRLAQLEKKFAGIDINEYNQLKEMKTQKEQEEAIKRQDFEKVLTQVKTASEQKISALTRELETIKIDGSLISEASQRKAVAPDKVAALLRNQIKLTAEGSVEIVDTKGQVRYNADKAQPLTVGELVDEFLKENPFFVAAAPAGTGTRTGNAGNGAGIPKIDLQSLDMKNPEHRKVYAEYRKQTKIST
jgi:hypothetical protein